MWRRATTFLMVLCCAACGTVGRSDGDTDDVHLLDGDIDAMDGSIEADDVDADLSGRDAVEVMPEQEGVGPQDSELDGSDTWEGKPSPRLLLCREGFVDCLDIESVKTPYLRHGGWLRIESGTPAFVPIQMAIALDQVPVPCASNVCDVTLEPGDHGDGVEIDVVVRYGGGFSQNEWRSWTVPIFDCDAASGSLMCVAFRPWEVQEPVLEVEGDVAFQGWDVAQHADGTFGAGLMVSSTSAEGDVQTRLWVATGGSDGWSRSQVASWNDGPLSGVQKSGGVSLAFSGDALRVAYRSMIGIEGSGGLHVDRLKDEGALEPLLFLPSWGSVEGADVQCGGDPDGIPRIVLDSNLGQDEAGLPIVTFRTVGQYFFVANRDGAWHCDGVTGTDPDGQPRFLSADVGSSFSSMRVSAGSGGALHAVMGNTYGAFYETYASGSWTDSLFVEHDLAGAFHYFALNAIAIAPDDAIDHAYVVADAPGYLDGGVAFGVRRIRDGKIIGSSGGSLVSALLDAVVSSGRAPEEPIGPMGLEVRDDACGRQHVLLVEHDHVDAPSAVYSFSTLSGSWRGEWLDEIQPSVGSESGNVQNNDPFFFDNQGRQHLFYPLRPKGNDPEGTPSRLMHWIRPCEVYLTE